MPRGGWACPGVCMPGVGMPGGRACSVECMVRVVCMVKGGMRGEGACVGKGGMHGKGGECVAKGGHAWYSRLPSTRYGRSMSGWYASYWNAFLYHNVDLLGFILSSYTISEIVIIGLPKAKNLFPLLQTGHPISKLNNVSVSPVHTYFAKGLKGLTFFCQARE